MAVKIMQQILNTQELTKADLAYVLSLTGKWLAETKSLRYADFRRA